ncbi:MAG: TetR/AcrR family transcriptional regulator [Acidimicrobiales bacterium]|nr:TetR/AcrR family transcriptional regulator [Acidimicrobiales bacterium]MCB1260776.1 TetR/AcrR family transcriptional regulator [Acidimicrobiales bacterium]
MPRITAPTIAEHVARQETAILDAAADLFAERGVVGTEMADIAEAVGIARSSLYRYFPDKDHILLAWFERELDPVIEHCRAIVSGPGDVHRRLRRWLDFQLDFLSAPEHQLAPRVAREVGAVSPEVQRELGAGHARLYRTLSQLVVEVLEASDDPADRRRDAMLLTSMIGGLVQAAGQAVLDGTSTATAKRELRRAVAAVLGS